MGKSLIIKGADFSENGMAPARYNFPYDIEEQIINESLLTQQSLSEYGRYSISADLYDEYIAGKTISGIKILISIPGTLTFFIQDPVNQIYEKLETVTFDSVGWHTIRFSKAVTCDNGKYISLQKRLDDSGAKDTAKFAFHTGADSSSNVRAEKFSYASGGITTGSLQNTNNRIFPYCFECVDL